METGTKVMEARMRNAHRFITKTRRQTTTGYHRLLTSSSSPTGIIAIIAFYRLILMTTYAGAEISEQQIRDRPLELGDIMPEDRRLYDKMRPPKYKGNATEVLFHVTVMSLDTIDESSMTYTCDVFFAQSWKDNRLRLPDNMTSEYRLLPIEWLTEIWRPDSFFKNAKDVTFQTMTIPNHYIWLWKDKTILYMVKLTLVLSCPMHFKNYPHDTQTCNLEIESISHTTDDLVFTWDPQMPLDVDKGIELPQLELISTKNDDCTTVYSTGKFTCLEVVFKFKRRLGYYLFHTYVPTCLIVIMSWISFWIKPEAVPARVTLGVTSLLTLSTQHANSQKSLPPVSYIKAIDVFMSGCTVFVFLSLMEYALVNIVMGDIADIEKKKSMGISNLILGNNKTGGPAPTATATVTANTQIKSKIAENTDSVDDAQKCPNHIGSKDNFANLFANTTSSNIGRGMNPLKSRQPMSYIDDGFDNPREEATSTGVGLSVGGLVDSIVIGGGSGNSNNSSNVGHTCGRGNTGGAFEQLQQSSDSPHSHFHNQSTHEQPTTPTNVIPLGPLDRVVKRQNSNLFFPAPNNPIGWGNLRGESDGPHQRPIQRESSFSGGADTTYFINPDGVMETVTTEAAAAATEAYGSHEHALASSNCLPPPVNDTRLPQPSSSYANAGGILSGENGTSGPPGTTGGINNVISQQGIKNLVHDVQIKRQREIRDMMKKKREKAVLVDRISRWLFPTSFILLNIVYWALFGDHELW